MCAPKAPSAAGVDELGVAGRYELGVAAGALSFVFFGRSQVRPPPPSKPVFQSCSGQRFISFVASCYARQLALVGCSGGVYCIFGIHIAELLMNWVFFSNFALRD